MARRLLSVAIKLWRRDATFKVGARVDTWRCVTLIKHLVASASALAAEEVVKANLIEAGGTGVGGKVPSDSCMRLVGAQHHCCRVPSDDVADPRLHRFIAREVRLITRLDGVDVWGRDEGRQCNAEVSGPSEEAHEQELGALGTVCRNGALDLADQARRLRRVGIRDLF